MDRINLIFLVVNILVGFPSIYVNAGKSGKIASHDIIDGSKVSPINHPHSNNPPSGCDGQSYCTNNSMTIFQRGDIEKLLSENFENFLRLYSETVLYKNPKINTLSKDTSKNVPCDISVDFQIVTYAQTFPYGWAPLVQEPNYFQYFRVEHCSTKTDCDKSCDVGSCNPRSTKCRTITHRQPVLVWQGDDVVSATAILPESCKCAKKKFVSTTTVTRDFQDDLTTATKIHSKINDKQLDQQMTTKRGVYGRTTQTPWLDAKTTTLPIVENNEWKNSLPDDDVYRGLKRGKSSTTVTPDFRTILSSEISTKGGNRKNFDHQTTTKRAEDSNTTPFWEYFSTPARSRSRSYAKTTTLANVEFDDWKTSPANNAYGTFRRSISTTQTQGYQKTLANFDKVPTEIPTKGDIQKKLDQQTRPNEMDHDKTTRGFSKKYHSTSPRYPAKSTAKTTILGAPLLDNADHGFKRSKFSVKPTPPSSAYKTTTKEPMTKSTLPNDVPAKKGCRCKKKPKTTTSPSVEFTQRETTLLDNTYGGFKRRKSTTVSSDARMELTSPKSTTEIFPKGNKRNQLGQKTTTKRATYGRTTQKPWMPLTKYVASSPRFPERSDAKTTTLPSVESDGSKNPLLDSDVYQGIKRKKFSVKPTPASTVYKSTTYEPAIESDDDVADNDCPCRRKSKKP